MATERVIRVSSRWFDHRTGIQRTSHARLRVVVANPERDVIPGEVVENVDGPIDGVPGFQASATGVRYPSVRDFLRQWGASPIVPA